MGRTRFVMFRWMSRPARRFTQIGLMWWAAVICSGYAAGQANIFDDALEPAPPELARNAAFWYDRALQHLERVPVRTMRTLVEYEWWWDAPVTDEVRLALEEVRPVLNVVQRGSRQRSSDFGLDVASGPAIRLPHLSGMRTLVRMLAVDAAVALRQDRARDAAEAISSIVRTAEHLNHDDVILSSMIGQSLYTLGEEVLIYGLDRAAFRPDEAAVLLLAIQKLDADDPFRYRTALRNHKRLFTEWAIERYSDDDGLILARDEISEMAFHPITGVELAILSREDFERQLHAADVVLERMVEALEMRDPEQARFQIQRLDRAVAQGDHGLIAQIFLYPAEEIFDRMIRARSRVAERRTSLRRIAEDRVDPLVYANAAVWYRRAARRINALPEESLTMMRDLVADSSRSLPGELRARLESDAEVVDLVLEGSLLDHCQFAAIEDSPPALLTWDQYSAISIGWYVLADVRRLLEDRQYAEAGDRLSIVLRLSRHLAEDQRLISAVIAHDLFRRAWSLIEQGLETARLETPTKRQLLREMFAFMPRDPFGHEAALEADRQRLRPWLLAAVPDDDERLPILLERMLERTTGEQLLGLLVLLTPEVDRLEQTIHPFEEIVLDWFTPLIDMDAVEQWFAQIGAWRGDAATGNVEAMFERRAGPVAAWTHGQRAARENWRAAVLRLRKEVEADGARENERR